MPDFEQPEDWAKRPHVVILLDESGSMGGSVETAVSAINDYLKGLKGKLPDETRVSLIKFTSGGFAFITQPGSRAGVRILKVFDRTLLKDIRDVTSDDYLPSGGTPLYDAIGSTIVDLDKTLKSEPAPVFFAILTDGEENSSAEYNLATVRKLLDARKETGWDITFMGVEIDAYAAGQAFGFAPGKTLGLQRGKMADVGEALSKSTATMYGNVAAYAAPGGAGLRAYSEMANTTATFSDEDKANLETE